MSINRKKNFCSILLIIFDLVKADGVNVKIKTTKNKVSRYK